MLIYLVLTYLFFPFFQLKNFFVRKHKSKQINKILLIQTAKIGDVVQITPLFREIKRALPHLHLSVMVTPVTQEILLHNPYIDSLITFYPSEFKGLKGKLKLYKFLKNEEFDMVLILNMDITYIITSYWTGIPYRISIKPDTYGFTKRLSFPLYTHLVFHHSNKLIIDTYFELLKKTLNIDPVSKNKEIFLKNKEIFRVKHFFNKKQRPFIGIVISAGNKLKAIPVKKWIEILKHLQKEVNGTFFLLGSQKDYKIAQEIVEYFNSPQIINTAGKFSLREVCAFVKNLNLLIGPDTGLIYIADTFFIPIVHIPGPANFYEQHPWQSKWEFIRSEVDCAPCTFAFNTVNYCQKGTYECLEKLNPAEIAYCAKKLLTSVQDV